MIWQVPEDPQGQSDAPDALSEPLAAGRTMGTRWGPASRQESPACGVGGWCPRWLWDPGVSRGGTSLPADGVRALTGIKAPGERRGSAGLEVLTADKVRSGVEGIGLEHLKSVGTKFSP